MIWKKLLEKGLSEKKRFTENLFYSQPKLLFFQSRCSAKKIEIFLLSQVFLFFIQNGFKKITFIESTFYLSHACLYRGSPECDAPSLFFSLKEIQFSLPLWFLPYTKVVKKIHNLSSLQEVELYYIINRNNIQILFSWKEHLSIETNVKLCFRGPIVTHAQLPPP